jgi:PHD/YefM family antitoxin component YafN of YafNO toxin-antitoxin module
MVRIDSIRSLSDFQRNTKAHVARLKATGQPEVLTVNGRAELVVQSAESYQRLLDAAELADSVAVLKERLTSVARGGRGIPLKQFDVSMRRKHRITRAGKRRS